MCVTKSTNFKFLSIIYTIGLNANLLKAMDRDEHNLFSYLFLRKIDKAFFKCAENNIIPIHKVSCAIKITQPKTNLFN